MSNSILAVNYQDSRNVFDASITYLNDLKLPYYIIVNIEGKTDSNLKYDVEIITKKKNQVIGSETISCTKDCELKVPLKKIFFDEYNVVITAGNYQKTLNFKLDKKETLTQIDINPILYYKLGSNLQINGEIKRDIAIEDNFLFEIFPKGQEEFKNEFRKTCTEKVCNFNFNISANIVLGEYMARIYSTQDTFEKSFNISLLDDLDLNSQINSNYESISNLTLNLTFENNFENLSENFPLEKYPLDQFSTKPYLVDYDNIFDGNFINLYYNLYQNSSLNQNIFNLNTSKNSNYILSTIFYNDYMIKYNSYFSAGSKQNYFSKFNISDYIIIASDNVKASIIESNGTLLIKDIENVGGILIITNKNNLNNTFENITTSEILSNTVFINIINTQNSNNNININNLDKNSKQTTKRIILPQKFSNNNYEFEMKFNENELKELSKIDNKFSRSINKNSISKNTLNYINKISPEINATLKFSGREIKFNNLKIDETGIDLKAKKLNKRFELNSTNNLGQSEKIVLNDIFAIDPEKISFENATMTKTAKGNALYKCKDWNYATDSCLGVWVKILNLIPGQNYSLELDKYDPAFAESNIIFEDDFEIGGALQSGLWTKVAESDSRLTQVWDIDTQYKYGGSYSLSDSPGSNYQPGAMSTGFLPHHSIYSPAINLSGLITANATFYQRLYLEADTGTSCWDAVLVKISVDGTNWFYTKVNSYTMRTISDNSQAERVTGDGYAMCGQYTTWEQVSINLTPYVGNETVYVKWSTIADDNTAFDGYNIDDFIVYGTENQKPQLLVNPTFNPTSISLGSETYLNMTIKDDTPITVIGTMRFSNGSIENYSILPEIKSKINSYTMLNTPFSEIGRNITVFSDQFTNLQYWYVTIGTNMFDWNVVSNELRATAVTAPRPQYATLAMPIDLRNFSQAIIQYQYKESGTLEAADCFLYGLNNGSSWTTDTTVFCDDRPINNNYYNSIINLGSSYMTKNFQIRFGANQFDNGAEYLYIDNFNLSAWHSESKTTGNFYGPVTFENYNNISRINVTIIVDSYNPTSSINKANTKPDLYIAFNDGTQDDLFLESGTFNLSLKYSGNTLNTTDATFTISITDPTILNYYEANPENRYFRIGAKYLDYTTNAIYDEIIYKSVIVTIEGVGQNNNYYYNFSNFPLPGTHNLTNLYIMDLFGLTNNTAYTNVNFTVNAYSSISEGYLLQNNIFIGENSTIKCNVIDNISGNPLNNYTVSFYRNSTLLGNNNTNILGWAEYNFNDISTINSQYNISCNISNSPINYYTASSKNTGFDMLNVWNIGADTIKPNIFSGSGSPTIGNVGLGFSTWVNATDNIKVENVWLYVKRPDEMSFSNYLMDPPGTINGSGQYTYIYNGDSINGTYYYYFKAEDNWTNPNWNVTQINNFSRIISDALIKITNKNSTYKKIQEVQITQYLFSTISNTTVGELTSYIGPYVIFNNSFADEFTSWTTYTNPSGTSLYCGDGGAGYEDLDVDTGGSATSRTPGTDNSAARFSMESSTYTLGGTGYAYFEKNLSLAGYSNANVTFYLADNGVDSMVSGDYPFTFDIYDGTWYQAYTQQGASTGDTAIISSDYVSKEVSLNGFNMINNFRIRFSGGGANSATTDHFAIDDVLVTANAIDKTSKSQIYTFGTSSLNLSYFNIELTITSYDNRGSTTNTEPDISIEFYNGSLFSTKDYCNLQSLYGFIQSSSPTDINCTIKIIDPQIIKAWENPNNRKIRINAEYVDVSSFGSDSINWSNVYFNYYTPSLIYNPGIVNITSYISNRIYLNSTNELKGVVNITPVTIPNGLVYSLAPTWNSQFLPLVDLPNGVYYSSSALTDGSGNIISDSNANQIVSTDYFDIHNLYVNITSPIANMSYNSSVWVNITLDNTYYSGGGMCNYTLNSNITSNMSKIDATHYSALISVTNFTSYANSIQVYCNDSTGDIVTSKNIPFSVDTGFLISFISPTDTNGIFVNKSSTYINVSISTLGDTSGYINFNSSQVLYYNFNNISATTIYDSSSYHSNAILNNSKVKSDFKIRGNYSYFNRSNNEFIEIISPNSNLQKVISGNSKFTISCWFNPSSMSLTTKQTLPIFEAYNSTGTYFNLGIESGTGNEKIYFITSNLDSNITFNSADINWLNGTWYHLALTGDYFNSTHLNITLYSNGNYLNSNLFEKNKFPLNINNYYIGKSIRLNNYYNGSIDEFMVSNRVLSNNELKALYNSKLNILQNNFTKLKNGLYNYQACAIREDGSYLCTENRTININITLPLLTLISPLNGANYNYNESIYFNVSTQEIANKVWYVINNNSTNFSLNNISSLNWSNSNSNFFGGNYNVTFYASDDAENLVNISSYFYIAYFKDILIQKKIEIINSNSYKATLNLTNYGTYKEYILHDFINNNFTYYNLSSATLNLSNINGVNNGTILKWNISLNQYDSSIITYYFNSTGNNSYISNNLIIGSE